MVRPLYPDCQARFVADAQCGSGGGGLVGGGGGFRQRILQSGRWGHTHTPLSLTLRGWVGGWVLLDPSLLHLHLDLADLFSKAAGGVE